MSSQAFAELHQSGTFLLVNVTDVPTAVLAERAGAKAIATTSAGQAHALGRSDGAGRISLSDVARQVSDIVKHVSIPLSVDGENGWGHGPEDVANTVRVLADAGAAGASIEDFSGDPAMGIYDKDLAVERIQAAVEAAASLADPFVVCARAEGFLYGVENPLEVCLDRLQAFAAVGAHCVYAPGPSDIASLAKLASEAGAPLNALIGMTSPLTMNDAAAIGVRRVSVGSSLFRAQLGAFEHLVKRMLTAGSFATDVGPSGLDFDALFGDEPHP